MCGRCLLQHHDKAGKANGVGKVEKQGFRWIEQNTIQKSYLALLLNMITIGGLLFCIQSMFHGEKSVLITLVTALLCACAAFFFYQNQDRKAVVGTAFLLIVMALVVLVCTKEFEAGAMDFFNQIIANCNYITGLSLEYFVVPDVSNMEFSYYLFYETFAVGIGLYLGYAIVRKHWVPVLVVWLPVIFAAVFLEMDIAAAAGCMAFISIVGCFAYSHMQVREEKVYLIGLCGLVVAVILITYASLGGAWYQPNDRIAQLKESVTDKVHTAKYGQKDLPEGDIAQGIHGDDGERLTVTSEKSGKLYLKGFVGSVFQNGKWKLLDGKEYGKRYEGMFQQYQKEGFHPLAQLAGYDAVTESTAEEKIAYEKSSVTVKNTNAYQRYVYVPYGADFKSLSALQIFHQDLNLMNPLLDTSVQVENTYEVDVTKQDEILGYTGAEWLDRAAADGEQSSYRDIEKDYRKFVYAYYTELTEQQKERVAGMIPKQAQNILAFTDGLRKNLKQTGQQQNWDALHYATEAVLAFRSSGIPARYVEGYEAVTGEEPTPTGKYVALVTGQNAHAWAEIYKDGVGWIPVDVTPGHYENLTQKKSNSPEQVEKKQTNTSQKVVQKKQKDEEEQKDVPKQFSLRWIAWLLLAVVVMVMVLGCLVILGRRKWIENQRRKQLQSPDSEQVFLAIVAYMAELLPYCGIEEEQMPSTVRELLQTYWYAPKGSLKITITEIVMIAKYAEETQKSLWEQANRREKLKLRYWLCMEFPFAVLRFS